MIDTEKIIKDLKDRLENFQILLMQDPQNKCLWVEDRDLQDRIRQISLSRKYIGPNENTRAGYDGCKNTKYSQMVATTRK